MAHKDSTGSSGVVTVGEVQVMSAGTGIFHSEFNAHKTNPVSLFQIWIFPKEYQIKPRYNQKKFDLDKSINNWLQIVSGDKNDNTLWINQDAQLSLAKLEKNKELEYKPKYKNNGVYILNIQREFQVEGETLTYRDAIGIENFDKPKIKANSDSRILAIEIPMIK